MAPVVAARSAGSAVDGVDAVAALSVAVSVRLVCGGDTGVLWRAASASGEGNMTHDGST